MELGSSSENLCSISDGGGFTNGASSFGRNCNEMSAHWSVVVVSTGPRTNSGVPECSVLLGVPRSAAVLIGSGLVFCYWRVTMSYLCRLRRIQFAGYSFMLENSCRLLDGRKMALLNLSRGLTADGTRQCYSRRPNRRRFDWLRWPKD